MHKNTGTNATPDNLFTDGDLAQGIPRSLLESEIMNTLLLEGSNLVERAGMVLDPDDDAQWSKAVQLVAAASLNTSVIINGGCVVAQDAVAALDDVSPTPGQVDMIFGQVGVLAGAGTPVLEQAPADWSLSGSAAQISALDASAQANTATFIYRVESRDALHLANGPALFACSLYQSAGQILQATIEIRTGAEDGNDDWSGATALVGTSANIGIPHGLATLAQFGVADMGSCEKGIQIAVTFTIPAGVDASVVYQMSELRMIAGNYLIPYRSQPYTQELYNCRRYFERYTIGNTATIGLLLGNNSTQAHGHIIHNVPKRVSEVNVFVSDTSKIEVRPGPHAVSTLSEVGGNISTTGVEIIITSTGLTADTLFMLRVKPDEIIDLTIDARLYPYSVAAAPSAPAAPATITVPIGTDTDGNYTVSWDASATALTYKLDQQYNGGGWSNVANTASLSKIFSSKPNGTYRYRVRAQNADGNSVYTYSVVFTVDRTPAAPATITTPTGTDTDGAYSISWDASVGATSYELQEQKDGGAWITIYDAGNTSFAVSGRTDGSYNYRVRACNSSGCSTYKTGNAFTVNLPPAAPVLTADGRSNGVDVSWTTPTGATTYELQRRINLSGDPFVTVFSGAGNQYSMVQQTPECFDFRVRAGDGTSFGPWSTTEVGCAT